MAQQTAAVGLLVGLFLLLLATDTTADFLTAFGKSDGSWTGPMRCPVEKFDCQNGKCITGSQWCDGVDHCGNNADELSCRICLSGSVKCRSSNQCVLALARCNGKTECQDGSDESGCPEIPLVPSTRWPLKAGAVSGASELLLSTSVLLTTTVMNMKISIF